MRPGIEIALVPITTAGDRDRTKPFGEIGSRGVFVKELEEALLEHRIDVAVHSAKDMTSTDPEGLAVGAYLERDDPRDALCGADAIRPGMRIGTASARRKAQLLALEPTLSIEPLRGNIDTRLRKRGERGLDAIVLAACGLDRLGLAHEIGLRFDPGAAAAGGRAGRARAAGARGRRAPRRRGRPRGDAAPRRGRARGCCRGRRRLPRAGRRPPRRHDADRARSPPRTARGSSGAAATTPLALGRELASLDAVRIVVTRAESQADPLAGRLEALGHEVVRCPLIRIEPLGDEPVDPSGYDWVVVTSPNGADELRAAPRSRRRSICGDRPGHGRGARCPRAARRPRPERVDARRACSPSCRPGRVLLAAAEGARRLLVDERGADFVPLYRTVELQPPAPDGDLVLLASPSAARAFAATGARIPAVAIGPQTAAAAAPHGLEVAAVAASHDVEGLLEAVTSISH